MSEHALNNELIRASAGAGKTFELTNRYLRLLRMGQRPDEILASTFTRKAAGEILARVLLRLAQAATSDDKLAEMRAGLGGAPLTREECLKLLVSAARCLHRLRIGTLDSFFAQLAGSFALEIGLPPGWRIAESHEDAALRNRAIEAVLDSEDTQSLLTLVHALTRGETTRSLDREVREKVNSLYTVYRESQRDAWHSLKKRNELSAGELDAAIEKLGTTPLPDHANWRKAHAAAIENAGSGDWASFVGAGLAAKILAGETSYYRKPIEEVVAADYGALIEHARAVLLNQLAIQTEATYKLLDRFHHQYQLLKQQSHGLRFDDITFQLVEQCLNLASGGSQSAESQVSAAGGDAEPAPDRVAFRLDARLHHLLLDEFQDTSLAQWAVLKPFASRITGSKSGRGSGDSSPPAATRKTRARRAETVASWAGQSFFCVGDVKQAIYGWRGGVAEIFDAVARELQDIQERPLDTSWRSSPHVIRAVNQIFQNVHRHSNLEDLAGAVLAWQKQFHEHRTAEKKQSLNGYARLQAARLAADDGSEGQKNATLRFAAEQVAGWRQRAPGFEIGVLVRRNDAVRRLIYELRELGIEASEEGGSTLDDSAAVRLILSLMRLADHPDDTVSRFHIVTSPLAHALKINGAAGGKLNAAAMQFAGRRGNVEAGSLARRIRSQLVEDGYGPTVSSLARQLAPFCSHRELRRLHKLIALAYPYDDAATSRPGDFVAYVDAAKVRDPIAADVRVMTVHQAKGLEFDIVVLADLESSLIGQRGDLAIGRPSPTAPIDRVCRRCGKETQLLLPEAWQKLFRENDEQDVVEAMCVLYVAVTRAKHALHMIVAPSGKSEKTLHKTFAGLLRASLTNGDALAPEQIAYETGDPEWFKNPGIKHPLSIAQVAAESESLPPLEVQLAPPPVRRRRGLQRVSPSGLEGGTHVRLSGSSDKPGGDRAAALAYGTLIHAWFEQVKWIEDGVPDDDRLREIATGPSLSAQDFDRALADFRAMLARPDVAACLKRTAYQGLGGTAVVVENERPIAVRDGDKLLVGSIDRLVTVYRNNRPVAADILDFKTDDVAANDHRALAGKKEFYQPQLSAYRTAVRTMLGDESLQVSARLLFVQSGVVAEIDS
jgi:ATP-dependent exoDNAse (exonuclease V) beta subunit